MPSAANVKIDKQTSPDNAVSETGNNSTPLRQAITIIEHKIRNLEKRKSKLESYKELQNSGKDLNADQKTAVAKYDEVIQTLEFARDLCKQFLGIANVSEREAKKQARKEAAAKSQSELAKIREVLLVQDALTQMGQSNIRDDFLLGQNGAANLTQADLNLLDELYPAVTPKHEAGNPTAFTSHVQSAAEHLLAVVDGKPKEAFGGTYCQIKEVIGKIHESGYLDQAQEASSGIVYEETIEVFTESEVPEVNHEPMPIQEMPPMETLSLEPTMPVQEPPLQMDPQQLTTEPIFYQQQPQQPPRPITEMLGIGNFYFLQDSELDTPPEQIPSQTFTNQTFVTAPPPPIPMPPHFCPPKNPELQGPPVVTTQLPPPVQPQPPQQAGNSSNNGLENPEQPLDKQRGGGGRPPRPPMNNHQQQQPPPHQQPYYQNNNGFNRPRQNRNGPRQGNRHN